MVFISQINASGISPRNLPGTVVLNITNNSQESNITSGTSNGFHYPPAIPIYSSSNSIAPNPFPQVSSDEQIGLTFPQNFASLAYNITATEQDANYSYGPGYLLNGFSNTGYWYQVGLSWDWPGFQGFKMIYAVFTPSGKIVLGPENGYNIPFSGPVNQGDKVGLYLYFYNETVVMYAYDWNTGAYAYETYSSENATYFAGSSFGAGSSQGTFTGLMTEQYHVGQYNGTEQPAIYSIISDGSGLSSGTFWMDEFNSTTHGGGWFACNNLCLIPNTFTNPNQFQSFTSHGAIGTANAYDFISGNSPLILAAPTPSNSTIDQGQSVLLNSIISNVTGGYTYNWLEETPGTSIYSSNSSKVNNINLSLSNWQNSPCGIANNNNAKRTQALVTNTQQVPHIYNCPIFKGDISSKTLAAIPTGIKINNSNITGSLNWAGYAVSESSPTVTSVLGSWIVQPAQPNVNATYSSQWIGIGGFSDSSLIQTGTESDYYNGSAHYDAWYELLPAFEELDEYIEVPGVSSSQL